MAVTSAAIAVIISAVTTLVKDVTTLTITPILIATTNQDDSSVTTVGIGSIFGHVISIAIVDGRGRWQGSMVNNVSVAMIGCDRDVLTIC